MLQELLVQLAQTRRELDTARQRMEDYLAADGFYQELAARVADLVQQEQELTAKVRQTALDVYKETENKRPHEKVSIKIFTKLAYDPKQAVTWCEQNFPVAVEKRLNKKEFEAFAKAHQNLVMDFVKVSKEPKAYISKSLDDLLP